MKLVDPAFSALATAKSVLLDPWGLSEDDMARALGEIFTHKVDYAEAYSRKTVKAPASKTNQVAAKSKRPVPAKYRHPQTGATWTGRGKAPRWVTAAEAEGQSRNEFLIKPDQAS